MISLFAGEERDAKRQSLKDPLVVLARHKSWPRKSGQQDKWNLCSLG
jgi:hypothetical protein